MPGGRGEALAYAKEAAEKAIYILEEYFEGQPDEIRAAAVKGVFDIYAASVVPTYLVDTGDHYK